MGSLPLTMGIILVRPWQVPFLLPYNLCWPLRLSLSSAAFSEHLAWLVPSVLASGSLSQQAQEGGLLAPAQANGSS